MSRTTILLTAAALVLGAALGYLVGRVTAGDGTAAPATTAATTTTVEATTTTGPTTTATTEPGETAPSTTRPDDDERRVPETAAEAAADYEAAEGLSFEVFGWSRAFGETVFDFDGDGDLDVLVMIHNIGDDPIWLQTPDGFVPSGVALPWVADEDWLNVRDRHGCAAADVDADGDQDLYCSRGANEGRSAKTNELWIQGPAGTLTEVFGHGAEDPYGRGRAALFLDLDGDEYPDLYVANSLHERSDGLPNGNAVFRNDGDGTFTRLEGTLTQYHGANCIPAAGDWNGDGLDDLAICPEDADLPVLYQNDGTGGFSAATDLLGDSPPGGRLRDVELTDLDGDGLLDLIWVAPTLVEVRLNRPGEPGGRFSRRDVRLKLDDQPYAVAAADLDRDGVRDLYVGMGGRDCNATKAPPDGRDFVLLGPSFETQVPAPYVRWGCTRMVESVGPEAVVVINGLGNNEGPFTAIRPSG